MTYDEAVEPRFAIISVTNAAGQQETTAAVSRSPANPDTLLVPLRPHLPEGWYLIYWRAISVDGHPVQGAFTYAVGPNPGPAPQFKIPNIAAGATSAQLLITRWVMFLSVMIAIGLFAFRIAIARPLIRRVPAARLRAVSIAFVIASVIGLIAIPVYLDSAVANDSLRPVFDLGALVPLYRVTAFGRAYVDMILCFGLFCVTAWTVLWLDRPGAETRSIAELVATSGAVLAAVAVLMIPGAAGHAAQTSPRGYSLLFDWLHLASGSLWLGGLVGLLVLWFTVGVTTRVPALSTVVPRFSNVAFVSVLVLLGTGTGATMLPYAGHQRAVGSRLRCRDPGQDRDPRRGALPGGRKPAPGQAGLSGARDRPELAGGAAQLLRVLIGGEAILVAGAVFVAAVLSSLAPPPPAFALQNSALAQVGPGRVAATVKRGGYVLQVLVSPTRQPPPIPSRCGSPATASPSAVPASPSPSTTSRCRCPSRNTSSPKPNQVSTHAPPPR